ncbi:MFS transporter [Streptomyces sp. SID13666]|uniref:MFS transporter n=1 Tax=unclassified Streptomyces TaxID=2593676 RepID=UPI0013C1EDC0|nr:MULTISPECIES: MFS transporter [unclassified Streptomyces]NEA59650.1 MFS transporter [Streptomyces sp. SID13666]NEA75827.1 MFS transporter [Streptomyces sp. SID13588]
MSSASVRLRSWSAVLVRERARPERVRNRPGGWWLAVATVCFGAFMGQLDASIVTLTYGSLRQEFGASLAAVEWVSLAYLLTLVALLIPVGRLSDAHGRKLVYLYGFVVFTAASAACGLAPSLGALVGFRVVQAAGAAMMQANSVALVATSAPREKMRSALGVQAAAQALGLALGPTVGGALVATLGWRWVFGINVPIGVVALIAGHYLLPRTRGCSGPARFDWPGLAWLATATTSLLLGVSAASGLPVPGWAVAALFTVAAVAGFAFVVRQRRAAAPLLDLTLLRGRAVSSGLVGALCGYLVLFGPLVLVPTVLTGAGTSALTAGLVLTALPAGFALAATGADRLLPRTLSDRARCVVGASVCAGALAVMLLLPLTEGRLVLVLVVLGLGLGTFTPANNTLIMGAMPAGSSGTGGGLVNMARGLGTALGVALVALALHLAPPGGWMGGPRWAVLVLLAAAALTLLAALLGPRRDHDDARGHGGRSLAHSHGTRAGRR